MNDMAQKKAAARSEILVRRNALPLEIRLEKSASICEQLYAYLVETLASENNKKNPLEGKAITVYSAMQSEVSLEDFIKQAYREKAHVYFPCMTKDPLKEDRIPYKKAPTRMIFREIPSLYYEKRDSDDDYSIPFIDHPLKSYLINDETLGAFPPLEKGEIDIVIVPMVAFDKSFNRLGYGGGNYDEFLAGLNDRVIVVGVAFAEQEAESIPLEEHDLPLPRIISA